MIEFLPDARLFHLRNDFLSLVLTLRADEEGCDELLMNYLGAPVADPQAALFLSDLRPGASFDSLRQVLPYACPTEGRGDYRPPMACARDASGQRCTELFYNSHRIVAGKPALEGLPASYVEDDSEAQTLLITLRDDLTGLE